jgi:hypothetical protein
MDGVELDAETIANYPEPVFLPEVGEE